jgi:APA family basic amino acid/polyamine antiporter
MVELKKELGLKEVVATVVTSVIGGGLFLTTIQIQDKIPIGSSVIFSYILAAIPALFIALCYAVLSSAMPSSGGEYVFISRIIDPFIGFIVTWARWFAMIAVIAAMSVGDIAILNHFFKIIHMENASVFISMYIQVIAIILVILFLLVNYLGVKLYGRIQTIMFVLLMIGLFSLIIFGLPHVTLSNLSASFNPDLSLIAQASSLIFFSYIGFSAITDAGDEVKNAKKTLPRGIIISIFTIALIYILVAVIIYGSISPSFYSSYNFAEGSVADVAASFLPFIIAAFVAFTGSIAIISDINPTILSTSRLTFAWARDRIVPEKLAELNKYNVPKWTLLINAIMAISIIMIAKAFIEAVMMINMAVLLIFITISITALVLPYKHPEIYNKAKFKIKAIPIIALIGLITSSLFLIFILRLSNAMPGFLLLLTWISIGSIVYIYTQEKHQLHWRIQKQQRKEKDDADKELIKELVSTQENKIFPKKK